MMKRRVVIALALIGIASPALAWSQPGITLEGLVRDASGGIARAEVSAVDSLTNERGFFRMLGMSPGRYAVSARIIGYAAGDSARDAAPLCQILETEADGSGNGDKSKIHQRISRCIDLDRCQTRPTSFE